MQLVRVKMVFRPSTLSPAEVNLRQHKKCITFANLLSAVQIGVTLCKGNAAASSQGLRQLPNILRCTNWRWSCTREGPSAVTDQFSMSSHWNREPCSREALHLSTCRW